MKWVKQDEEYGCAIACVAMLAELDYWVVRNMTNVETGKGFTHYYTQSLLFDLGFLTQQIYHHKFHNDKKRELKPFAPFHIATVITNYDTIHAVVMDKKGRIYDPQKEGVYKLSDYKELQELTGVWRNPSFK